MQAARHYIPYTTASIERALGRMPFIPVKMQRPSIVTPITRYVEELLTDEEQRICDMATD